MGKLAVGIEDEARYFDPGVTSIDAALAFALKGFVGRTGVAVGREAMRGLDAMGSVAFCLVYLNVFFIGFVLC